MTVQGIATSDFQGLNELKNKAKLNQQEALPEVAKQFEGIFLQSMLKAMRTGQHFLDESSPFNGKNQETFQDMLDGQYANNIANSKGIGLADMLTKQLSHSEAEKKSATNPIDEAHAPLDHHDSSSTAVIDHFVKTLWPKAKEAAATIGLDPKILMAQAALETGWGKFIAKAADGTSSNNLFNVKTGNNKNFDSIQIRTTEYIADNPINVTESFRKYSSVEQSVDDYVSLIKGSDRYQEALANANNPELYVNELHKAGYATDPKYSTKILSIYHGDELNQAMQRCGISGLI